MADLQSAALATWLRRRNSRPKFMHGELFESYGACGIRSRALGAGLTPPRRRLTSCRLRNRGNPLRFENSSVPEVTEVTVVSAIRVRGITPAPKSTWQLGVNSGRFPPHPKLQVLQLRVLFLLFEEFLQNLRKPGGRHVVARGVSPWKTSAFVPSPGRGGVNRPVSPLPGAEMFPPPGFRGLTPPAIPCRPPG